MNYTYTQLARVLPESYRRRVWQARASRLWKRYLRLAAAVADVLGSVLLTLVYFVVLAPFALLAKRAERRETAGWKPIAQRDNEPSASQY
jgi:predicted LPLAT superfamily acyltransferase